MSPSSNSGATRPDTRAFHDAPFASPPPSGHRSRASRQVGQCFQTVHPIPPPVAPIPSGSQVGDFIHALAWLDAKGEELKGIDFTVDFVAWILRSDFYRLQQPEPMVGHQLANCPQSHNVEERGIKGQSVYTALFDNADMETFTCRMCRHKVKYDLELAITHQRVHFHHSPYQCSGTQTQCGRRFPSALTLAGHLATEH